jgi:hypothetical protein
MNDQNRCTIETVSIVWPNVNIHYPPEMPVPLSDILPSINKGWIMNLSTYDETKLKALSKDSSISSSKAGTTGICSGRFDTNLENLEEICDIVKKMIEKTRTKYDLDKERCESVIKYNQAPFSIKARKNVKFSIPEYLANKYGGSFKITDNKSVEPGIPFIFLDNEKDITEAKYIGTINEFKSHYKNTFRRTLSF